MHLSASNQNQGFSFTTEAFCFSDIQHEIAPEKHPHFLEYYSRYSHNSFLPNNLKSQINYYDCLSMESAFFASGISSFNDDVFFNTFAQFWESTRLRY